MTTNPLDAEREALGAILRRLMDEVTDLETLCKHAPRIVGVAVNAARVQAALIGDDRNDDVSRLRQALLDADNEEMEEAPW
ncbi:MAG: hypothetical protein M9934_14520 [Thermomicrobiales bacterium]|nr:hypothetical protein [Thermomicrobiales bacterium]MCO5229479.1 hypothetical protein [Thermomicrobiales bacterium]